MKEENRRFSIIDEGFSVEGTVSGKGRLVIKGHVKGMVSGQRVVIAEEGDVQADVRVVELTIGGNYRGSIEAEGSVTILASGRCTGKVSCRDLIVEPGGKLNASVTAKR